MQSLLLARELGEISPEHLSKTITTNLLKSFAPAPQHRFDGRPPTARNEGGVRPQVADDASTPIVAHKQGVSTLTVDKFDGRLLISGGSDGSIRFWDLDTQLGNPLLPHTFRPIAIVPRATVTWDPNPGHRFGVTHLAFYPFDSDAFLSSSHDRSLILWSTTETRPAQRYDLEATVYSHAISPISSESVVACATQHSAVRLVDLKTRSSVQELVASVAPSGAGSGSGLGPGSGPVLSVAWSPRKQHVLASGHADGSVRIWDVRKANGIVGLLDAEDSLGVVHRFDHAVASGRGWTERSAFRLSAKAHADAVNGLAWTDCGLYLVSAGLDRKMRVWDATTGANTLASFGNLIQNQHARTQSMIVSPAVLTVNCREVLFWPNEREILALDLHEGSVISRLRNASIPTTTRINAIAWRGYGAHSRQGTTVMGGASTLGGIYSAHTDGQVRVWMPLVAGPDPDAEFGGAEQSRDHEGTSKKRKALDDAFNSLMGRKVKFT